jgi:hypothetical protein
VYASAGTASAPSIQRQALSPTLASMAFDANAAMMPKTMLN